MSRAATGVAQDAESPFRFYGGHVALDFVNTVGWRLADDPGERLVDFDDFVRWVREAGVVDERGAAALARAGQASPRRAAALLRRARDLRDSAYRLFEARVDGKRPARGDLDAFNAWLRKVQRRAEIRWNAAGYDWVAAAGDPLERVFERLVRAIAELLTSDDASRVAQCQDDRGCGWLFLDRSRSRRRRWCSMAECGNRAKARRFRSAT